MELDYIGGTSSQQYNNWLTEDTHVYEVKFQSPMGDRELRIPVKTRNRSEDDITNEIVKGINSQLGGFVQATKVNKPVKKLSLKIHAK